MSNHQTPANAWQTDDFDIPAYLCALGVEPAPPTLDLVEALHGAHVRTLPFANVDVLLGHHPGVSPGAVQAQLIERRRGGYCFEHAQIFAAALEHLGFTVQRRLGRVHEPGNSRTHMSVQVDLDGRSYLCDPGFGFSITGPIPLEDGATRSEGNDEFTLRHRHELGSPVWALVRKNAVQHYTDDLAVHPEDVRMGHHYTSTGPSSVFRKHLMVMRHLADRHVSVTERTVTTRAPGRETEHREISPGEAVELAQELGVALQPHEARELTQQLSRLEQQ